MEAIRMYREAIQVQIKITILLFDPKLKFKYTML